MCRDRQTAPVSLVRYRRCVLHSVVSLSCKRITKEQRCRRGRPCAHTMPCTCLSNSQPTQVCIPPPLHHIQHRQKALPQLCQLIFHVGRHLLKIMAEKKPIRFQFPQLFRQRGLRNTAAPASTCRPRFFAGWTWSYSAEWPSLFFAWRSPPSCSVYAWNRHADKYCKKVPYFSFSGGLLYCGKKGGKHHALHRNHLAAAL